MAIFNTIYRATGTTYYARFVARISGNTWNDTTKVVEAGPSWANSVVTMTEVPDTGQFPIQIPALLPKGYNYDVTLYLQAGAVPVNTDAIDSTDILKLGSIFGF